MVENNLLQLRPNLAVEWDYKKNYPLRPEDVTLGSNKKVWWIYPYDDPRTGKHFDFTWQSVIGSRVRDNLGCPYLSNKRVWQGFNDLASYPEYEYLVKQWHPYKNGNLTPYNVSATYDNPVWWLLPYDDRRTGKHFDFEWKASVYSRTKDGLNCPYLSSQKIWRGFNDLTSYPEYEYLIKQWHPTKNGNLKPCDVMPGSKLKVWWIFPYDDISTGKHYDFEWESYISNRTLKGTGCPFLTPNPLVFPGFNDLKTKYPKIVKDWDYEKNGNLKPDMITYASHKKVYWQCEKGHSWCIEVKKRTLENHNCPICSNQKVLEGYNDLASHPQYGYLVKEWHPTKNGDLKPTMVTPFTSKKVYWLCPNGHTYQASLCNRTRLGQGCRECAGSAIEKLAYSILRKYNIDFDKEYSFKSNIEIGKYRYDIYMKKFKMIVELDGAQHFKSDKSSFFNEELPFEERVRRDNLKNKFALENKIPILRIPYVYLPGRDKEKIENFINTFLFTKQVPQEIIDFYGTYEFSNYMKVAIKCKRYYKS